MDAKRFAFKAGEPTVWKRADLEALFKQHGGRKKAETAKEKK